MSETQEEHPITDPTIPADPPDEPPPKDDPED